mmetsp:Transcript_50889/g.164742  ORF Transcript_50889/g.164742 Transcript_50889/m.164742 type:complete len:216 (-) Transcript_50889:265-912(-)
MCWTASWKARFEECAMLEAKQYLIFFLSCHKVPAQRFPLLAACKSIVLCVSFSATMSPCTAANAAQVPFAACIGVSGRPKTSSKSPIVMPSPARDASSGVNSSEIDSIASSKAAWSWTKASEPCSSKSSTSSPKVSSRGPTVAFPVSLGATVAFLACSSCIRLASFSTLSITFWARLLSLPLVRFIALCKFLLLITFLSMLMYTIPSRAPGVIEG